MLTLGIDEAGKGPIIGSMFIVGTLFEESELPKLKNLGIKDSKLLTHKKRVILAKEIKKIAKKIKIIELTPKEIDEAIDGNNTLNLNWLEALKQAEIINELNPDKAIIDCPSPNINKYTEFLKSKLKKDLLSKIKLIIEHKADYNFIECASASIIAKVMREDNIADIQKKVGKPIGSGYPADEKTTKFLKESSEEHDHIFRKSWSTYKKHKNSKKQAKLDKF